MNLVLEEFQKIGREYTRNFPTTSTLLAYLKIVKEEAFMRTGVTHKYKVIGKEKT
jgi:hypothetical protein